MNPTIFTVAHEATVVAYVVFALLVMFRGSRSWLGGLLFIAVAATALWAQTLVANSYDIAPTWLAPVSDGLRDAAWMALCLGLIYRRGGNTIVWRGLIFVAGVFVATRLGFDLGQLSPVALAGVHIDSILVRIALTVLGLVLIENIFRNSSPSEFWSLKHLLIGLLCILIFQLFSAVPEFLTHAQDANIAIARPLVFLLVLPLFVVSSVRFPNLQLRIHSSRTFVFYSATLVGAGIMLQGVAIAAWYVREYGGSNGTILAITLLFAGAAAVAVALVSSGVRSRVRQFINENFFSLKYDYRVEWERVIRALSLNPEQGSAERVLRVLCDLLDSPGGAIWIHRASWHQFLPAAKLGFASEFVPIPENDPRITLFRDQNSAFLELANTGEEPGSAVWHERFVADWIVVPLRYRSSIVGVTVLAKTRAPKKLDWEDENLIRLVALQLGAYLVQEETAQSLADARQLEEFNKRFAFVVHDIKNTIGQLSLLVRNAAQFGHQKEFREDMVVTLGNAVERLQQLLKSLTEVGRDSLPGSRHEQVFDLIKYLEEYTKEKGNLGQAVVLVTECSELGLELADITNLRRVLDHVVSNATEASGEGKSVEIFVTAAASSVDITVTDHGKGMTEKFVNEELFRPMRTTKDGGFGIGAYQARELMRDLGGDIFVTSTIGEGTSVTLSLPRTKLQGTRSE